MTLKECYVLVGVQQSATLDEVKRAYRKRAFELHPDLNPHMGDAGKQFQQLNEAYVILTRLIAARETREERLKAERDAKNARQSASSGKTAHATSDDSSRQETGANSQTASSRQTYGQGEQSADTPPNGTTEQKDQAKQAQQASQTSQADSGASKEQASTTDSAQQTHQKSRATTDTDGEKVYAEQQEVLRDILNDPFARRVFEDIYSEIRKKGHTPGAENAAHNEQAQNRTTRKEPFAATATSQRIKKTGNSAPSPSAKGPFWSSMLDWGQHKIKLDFSKGMGGVVKDWLRGQIDEEQIFQLPASKLFPGARVRLQIRHGLSDDVTTLDVTLPPDFISGKPIRLKGMGKKLGRWQGDLYLTLLVKS